jgi:hypothetical protein
MLMAWPQKLFELVGGEADIAVIVEEDVEFVIAGGVLDADTCSCEVGRAGDDGARLVFAEAARDKDVELGVETLGGVGFDLDAFGRDIGDKLANAVFNILAVRGALNVGLDLFAGGGKCFVGVTEEQESFAVLLGELRVHINADKDADECIKPRSGICDSLTLPSCPRSHEH